MYDWKITSEPVLDMRREFWMSIYLEALEDNGIDRNSLCNKSNS